MKTYKLKKIIRKSTKIVKSLSGYNSSGKVGRTGEKLIETKLSWIDFWGKKGLILKNIYVPKNDGGTSGIDLLYITSKGLIVIESKNYSGYIFGDDRYKNWTATLYGGKDWLGRNKVEKHQFYNPVWQNRTHLKSIRNYLGANIDMFSVIVFSDRCELKNISLSTEKTFICHKRDLNRVISSIWKKYPDVLTEGDIEFIYERLFELTNVDNSVKTAHVYEVERKKYNDNLCPYCGGELVLRTARQGPNAGNQFYGCSNYPKCRYTRNI